MTWIVTQRWTVIRMLVEKKWVKHEKNIKNTASFDKNEKLRIYMRCSVQDETRCRLEWCCSVWFIWCKHHCRLSSCNCRDAKGTLVRRTRRSVAQIRECVMVKLLWNEWLYKQSMWITFTMFTPQILFYIYFCLPWITFFTWKRFVKSLYWNYRRFIRIS